MRLDMCAHKLEGWSKKGVAPTFVASLGILRHGTLVVLRSAWQSTMFYCMTLVEQSAQQFLCDRRDVPLTTKPAYSVWLRRHPLYRRIDDAELYSRARKASQGKLHAVDRASCIAVLLSNR